VQGGIQLSRLGRSYALQAKITPYNNITAVPQTLWYALYDTTTGELLSLGTTLDLPLPSGTDVLVIGNEPDASLIWDTTARNYVAAPVATLVDRVVDLVADPTLTSAWASLSANDSQAMQARIGQMLGPYRYRFDFQDIDLQAGWGSS